MAKPPKSARAELNPSDVNPSVETDGAGSAPLNGDVAEPATVPMPDGDGTAEPHAEWMPHEDEDPGEKLWRIMQSALDGCGEIHAAVEAHERKLMQTGKISESAKFGRLSHVLGEFRNGLRSALS